MGVTRVEVEIRELVLHGFNGVDGVAVAAFVERALGSRLVQAGGAALGQSRSVDRIEAPAIKLGARVSARSLGTAVADRLHGSLSP